MQRNWWKEQLIYQIYPRSFKDSNGDGIGDINGIVSKLDYLKELGVDIIWLGPVYESPNDDNGYDISNYYRIHPEFGTMEDFDVLLSELKKRGIKLIMDLVVNHSSDEHEWFEKSRSSKSNNYRDYYIWRPGKNGGPPNNWLSFFGGSAWEYDDVSEEYYLHLFTKKQPDLNWENPKLRDEIFQIIRFWLEKGIDGFRMDVVSLISKRLDFDDAEFESFGDLVERYYANGPRIHEFIQEMYNSVLCEYDIMTVGEGPGITKEVGELYVGKERNELNMIFHLDHMFLGYGRKGRFDPVPYDWSDIKQIFSHWDEAMGDSGWVSIFLDNHDFPRMVSRFGDDNAYRNESSKLLAMLILTMRGTPCIYQGTELGMTNVKLENIDDLRDVEALNFYKQFLDGGVSKESFIELANEYGRDNARTPMQWDDSKNGGFTDGKPWIKVNPNYKEINAFNALRDENSIYYFYKRLIEIRKQYDTLIYGQFELLDVNSNLFVYQRYAQNQRLLIVLNHSGNKEKLELLSCETEELILSNYEQTDPWILEPWECRMYQLK